MNILLTERFFLQIFYFYTERGEWREETVGSLT